MSSAQITKIVSILTDDNDVTKCTCFEDDERCTEKGKIKCLPINGTTQFLHIRFDPCMIPNTGAAVQPKRCDCVIFAFDPTKKKQAMFVIEVKDTYNKPDLSSIKEKIQTCIARMQVILGGAMNMVEIYPIMTDEKHSTLCTHASMTKNYKVNCYNTKKSIILCSYRKNIVEHYSI